MFLNRNSHDVKIRYIPGKDPTMVFLNADNKVVLVSNHKTAYHEVSHLLLVLSSTLLHVNSGREVDVNFFSMEMGQDAEIVSRCFNSSEGQNKHFYKA